MESVIVPAAVGFTKTVGAGAIGYGTYLYYKFVTQGPNSDIERILQMSGLYEEGEKVIISARIVEEGVTVFRLHIPHGKSIHDFKKVIPAIQDKLNCEVKAWAEEGIAILECMTGPLPNSLPFSMDMLSALKGMECGILLGMTRKGLYAIDLADPRTPHILIGGGTGGGKSGLSNVIISTASLTYTPQQLEFYLIDLKGGVEFYPYRAIPHVKEVISEINGVSSLLGRMSDKIIERNRLFKEKGVRNITEYNRAMIGEKNKLSHIIVMADEIADFSLLKKAQQDIIYDLFGDVARKGRSAGIHLILSVQIADANVVPKQIKGNIPVRVGFRVPKRDYSEILMDDGFMADLPPIPGRCLMKVSDYTMIQVPHLTTEDIQNEIIPYLKGQKLPRNSVSRPFLIDTMAQNSRPSLYIKFGQKNPATG